MVKFKSSLAQITVALFCLVVIPHVFGQQHVHHGQGEMAGEVTDSTVILQSRLTQENQLVDGDLVGSPGIARSTDSNQVHVISTVCAMEQTSKTHSLAKLVRSRR